MAKNRLTPKTEDMSKWYTEVVRQAKLADYSPIKGCMVIRPNGYAIWEHIQKALDDMIKNLGVENAYFPMFIPMSFLQKEAEHVEGFAPELAVVTKAGGEDLEEPLAVRPTSETIMYSMYSDWIQSYRDLPLQINQWNSVVRWEKRTYLFLRTTEFLWQEAHTAHSTHEESLRMVLDGLEAYRKVFEDYLAVPVVLGRKSESEKFAGAIMTTTIESMMPDGKALQAGTSHDLGQNFSKKNAFDISFQNEKGETDYVWQTSYGLSTRSIGALIMTHGDNEGLVLPPRVARVQVAIIPVDEKSDFIIAKCNQINEELLKNGARSKVIFDPTHTLGWKLNEAEIQGIPITITLGNNEIENASIKCKVRHNGESVEFSIENYSDGIKNLLEKIQNNMFEKALKVMNSQISKTDSYDEFKKIMKTKRGFIESFWCESEKCEEDIKNETKASTRCLQFADKNGNVKEDNGVCIKCGKPAKHRWLFAQAY